MRIDANLAQRVKVIVSVDGKKGWQLAPDQTGQKTIYTYKDSSVPEDVGRLVKAHVQTSGGTLVDEWRYNYDAAKQSAVFQPLLELNGQAFVAMLLAS